MAWFGKKNQNKDAPATPPTPDPEVDTVGNPIIDRSAEREGDARHAAPDAGMTRAERRMLEFVDEGRISRTVMGSAKASYWRVDGAFATGTKATMLDWLLEQGYIEIGEKVRVAAPVTVTAAGRDILTEGQ